MKKYALVGSMFFLSFGCGANDGGTSGGGASNGKGGSGGGFGTGYFADVLQENPNTGGGSGGITDVCGLKEFPLDRLPGELMLVLDKSGSMRDRFPEELDPTEQRKWTAATNALDTVIQMTQDKVAWGLKLYPLGSGSCGGNAMPNPGIAMNNHSAIMMQIEMNAPQEGQYTPTRTAVQSATTYLMNRSTPNPKVMLLATDGAPNCIPGQDRDNQDPDGAVAAVKAAADAGIPVYVLGVAVDDETAMTLNRMAEAGGKPRPGNTKFYPAASQAELVAAMSEIAGQVASCTFQLGEPPPSPTDVAVDVDNARIQRDQTHSNGWDYGPGNTSINFFGKLCDDLKAGNLNDVRFTFGCPGMPIP